MELAIHILAVVADGDDDTVDLAYVLRGEGKGTYPGFPERRKMPLPKISDRNGRRYQQPNAATIHGGVFFRFFVCGETLCVENWKK